MEPRPTPVTEDDRRTEAETLAESDPLVGARGRKEELAVISKELADANTLTGKELADADILLAQKTQASAELLARTTQASAELLATITQESADQLRRSNEITTKMVTRLTIILVVIALIQTALTVVALFAPPR